MRSLPLPGVRLTVSVVLYNSSPELLRRSLLSLQRAAACARAAGRVSTVAVDVVDNSDDPVCRQRARADIEAWPTDADFRVQYHGMPENRGFGAGHNSVIRALESDFHLVLNPDAELAEDALRIGLACMQEDPGIALLSPRVVSDDGQQEFLCKRYPSLLALLLRAFAPRPVRRLFRRRLHRYEMRDVCSGEREVEVLLASGCFMLARTAALQAVGGFNDDYFLYFEDFDLSIRIGSQGRLVFNPAMQIVHRGGYAAKKGLRHVQYFVRSGVRFFRNYGWRWV